MLICLWTPRYSMIVRPHTLFQDALTNRYAIGAFNTSNLETTQAIIWGADSRRSPVIVQTSEGALEYAGLKVLSQIIRMLAEEEAVPVVLHLDHGKSLAAVQRCIEVGYTSVMIDASTLPLAENTSLTREVVDYAHGRGVWVEAELGTILGQEGMRGLAGGLTPDELLTRPEDVAAFVEETGVDALAVSVGTIHGAFTGQEYIRFELLAAIERAAPGLPLVIHGASGIAAVHLRRVAQTNVCKINVDTELRIAFEQAVRAYLGVSHEKLDPRELLGSAREAVQAVVEEKAQLFGSSGRAAM